MLSEVIFKQEEDLLSRITSLQEMGGEKKQMEEKKE